MLIRVISLSFFLLFVTTLALPTIIILVDDSVEITYYSDASEEEEEKGSEKNNEFELFRSEIVQNESLVSIPKVNIEIAYKFKSYAVPHLNLVFPPPDCTI
jgi:hypothetical protein